MWRCALLLSAAALIAGCNQQPASSADPSLSPDNGVASAESNVASAGTASSPSLWASGAQRPLDIQSAHPNGVVLQLTSLQSRPTETVIGMRVLNGRDREVSLNRFNNRNGYLVLDSGERLYLSPPPSNTNLSIPAGQTMEGELVFLGRLPPVKSATLILNENSSSDNQYSTTPGFRIDLPLGEGIS